MKETRKVFILMIAIGLSQSMLKLLDTGRSVKHAEGIPIGLDINQKSSKVLVLTDGGVLSVYDFSDVLSDTITQRDLVDEFGVAITGVDRIKVISNNQIAYTKGVTITICNLTATSCDNFQTNTLAYATKTIDSAVVVDGSGNEVRRYVCFYTPDGSNKPVVVCGRKLLLESTYYTQPDSVC